MSIDCHLSIYFSLQLAFWNLSNNGIFPGNLLDELIEFIRFLATTNALPCTPCDLLFHRLPHLWTQQISQLTWPRLIHSPVVWGIRDSTATWLIGPPWSCNSRCGPLVDLCPLTTEFISCPDTWWICPLMHRLLGPKLWWVCPLTPSDSFLRMMPNFALVTPQFGQKLLKKAERNNNLQRHMARHYFTNHNPFFRCSKSVLVNLQKVDHRPVDNATPLLETHDVSNQLHDIIRPRPVSG